MSDRHEEVVLDKWRDHNVVKENEEFCDQCGKVVGVRARERNQDDRVLDRLAVLEERYVRLEVRIAELKKRLDMQGPEHHNFVGSQ